MKVTPEFVKTVQEEAKRNPAFARGMRTAWANWQKMQARNRRLASAPNMESAVKAEGKEALYGYLETLELEQLRDIMSREKMGQKAMRWKNHVRVIDHIVELACSRADKDEVFAEKGKKEK